MRKKKKWTTPLLTVVVKGKPEERVLVGCKNTEVTSIGAASKDDTCSQGEPCSDMCHDHSES